MRVGRGVRRVGSVEEFGRVSKIAKPRASRSCAADQGGERRATKLSAGTITVTATTSKVTKDTNK